MRAEAINVDRVIKWALQVLNVVFDVPIPPIFNVCRTAPMQSSRASIVILRFQCCAIDHDKRESLPASAHALYSTGEDATPCTVSYL
jgi:hypothetical protein